MDVKLVDFPETKVAMITHTGSTRDEHPTAMKLILWKLEKKYLDQEKFKSYGLHHVDINNILRFGYRIDFCLSIEDDVENNKYGIIRSRIPTMRCAYARDVGSRNNNKAAEYILKKWLKTSGEELSGLPVIFHYVNTGPNLKESEAITDVYVPLKPKPR